MCLLRFNEIKDVENFCFKTTKHCLGQEKLSIVLCYLLPNGIMDSKVFFYNTFLALLCPPVVFYFIPLNNENVKTWTLGTVAKSLLW